MRCAMCDIAERCNVLYEKHGSWGGCGFVGGLVRGTAGADFSAAHHHAQSEQNYKNSTPQLTRGNPAGHVEEGHLEPVEIRACS